MDDLESVWQALHLQIAHVALENDGRSLDHLVVTNHIEEAIVRNNVGLSMPRLIVVAGATLCQRRVSGDGGRFSRGGGGGRFGI